MNDDRMKQLRREADLYALELLARRGLLNTPERRYLANSIISRYNDDGQKKGRKRDE